jgi:hypothetical protein
MQVDKKQVSIAVLYCAITVILYLDNILPYLINTAIDSAFLIALIVVSVIVGRPVSYLDCQALDNISNTSSSAFDFTSALGSSLKNDGQIDYSKWIGTSKSTCLEIKSIWGLTIALWYVIHRLFLRGQREWRLTFGSVLFTFSAICSVCLWRRSKSPAPEKGEA